MDGEEEEDEAVEKDSGTLIDIIPPNMEVGKTRLAFSLPMLVVFISGGGGGVAACWRCWWWCGVGCWGPCREKGEGDLATGVVKVEPRPPPSRHRRSVTLGNLRAARQVCCAAAPARPSQAPPPATGHPWLCVLVPGLGCAAIGRCRSGLLWCVVLCLAED